MTEDYRIVEDEEYRIIADEPFDKMIYFIIPYSLIRKYGVRDRFL